jgi:hypothetical protein
MILEGIVTTVSASGAVNVAPMGPRVAAGRLERFVLRPFPSSQTYRNLKAQGEGILHVTDDVLLLARAAIGAVEPEPALRPAQVVRGFVLREACRFYEFRVCSFDESQPRVAIEAEVVHEGRIRDFFGFNRAKHAVVEAAILATRTDFLPPDEIAVEFRKLAILVEKTGGTQEQEAFALLRAYIERDRQQRAEKGG